ncbi:radical SAM protein [Elusimicrobiota bacterium]
MSFNLRECSVCPLECRVDRLNENGLCGAGIDLAISSWNLHFGEEPPISGNRGSGTIFFAHCPLQCIFCQNYPISHMGHGNEFSEEEFIRMILRLQAEGAHNINFVTPTHYTPHIINVLEKIKGRELNVPVVFNCGGYEKVETLKKLDGLIDIYMPDAKFSDSAEAAEICNAEDYWEVNKNALKEMHRQVGDLEQDSDGIAQKGLLIRHLVLPGNISGTERVLEFIAGNISTNTYLSLMSQYHPAYKTVGDRLLGKEVDKELYDRLVDHALKLGLNNSYIQGM